jgi:hypothetical protein
MTEYKLKHLLGEWQKILRLQDWDIDIHHARLRAMQSEDGSIPWGRISINRQHRNAGIEILHPDDYADCDDKDCNARHGENEIESTLVHELLHIYIHSSKESEPSSVEEEQAINTIARALVELAHPGDPDEPSKD